MKVYRVVERRHGKVCELLDTAPVLEGLARAFARAALKHALPFAASAEISASRFRRPRRGSTAAAGLDAVQAICRVLAYDLLRWDEATFARIHAKVGISYPSCRGRIEAWRCFKAA